MKCLTKAGSRFLASSLLRHPTSRRPISLIPFTLANHNFPPYSQRFCTTIHTPTTAPALPPNLFIEDASVLEEDPRDVDLTPEWYQERVQPLGNIRTNLYSFHSPSITAIDSIKLDDRVFGSEVRLDIITRVVRWQRANRQAGTHKVKTISERSGTGRKPHPQKRTGKARQGTKRAPHHVKGGRVHGPVVRSHAFSLNKKVRRFGMRSMLAAKLVEGNLLVVDSLGVPEGEERMKTKTVAGFLKVHGWADAKVMFVDAVYNPQLYLATRNLHRETGVFCYRTCNVYDMLRMHRVVISQEALRLLEDRLQ